MRWSLFEVENYLLITRGKLFSILVGLDSYGLKSSDIFSPPTLSIQMLKSDILSHYLKELSRQTFHLQQCLFIRVHWLYYMYF